MRRLFLLCLLWFSIWQCGAAEPENGWWFSPDKALTGLDLELQNETLLIGYFSELAGQRIAYNAACTFANNTCSGEFLAGVVATGVQFSLSFPQSAVQGVAVIAGEQFTIERFEYGWAEPPVNLMGVWLCAILSGPVHTAETLVFSQIDDSSGDVVLEGVRDGTEPEQRAIVLYDADNDLYVVAVDDSAESVILYNLVQSSGLNVLSGTAVIVDRAGNPLTETFSAVASRILQSPQSLSAMTRSVTRVNSKNLDLLSISKRALLRLRP